MTTKLQIYNDALLLCGERFLGSLTEDREPRRLLDHVWDNGGVKACLEAGQWFFAMRTVQIDYDTSVEPDFGYTRAFTKPDDWCVTSAVCSDEFFNSPLLRYTDEANYWYADLDTIYVRYVSDDDLYGMNLLKWPEAFRSYVAAKFAGDIINKLTQDADERTRVMKLSKAALREAKGNSVMANPTAFPAQGGWSRSRNRGATRREHGNTGGDLIG